MTLTIVPIELEAANALVQTMHRHHGPKIIARFAIGVADGDRICGAAIVGSPVSRHQQDGWTLEVNRCVTDGTRNACSALYRACWRAVKAMGYRRMITYTLATEHGATLRGAGMTLLGERKGGNWGGKSRPRVDTAELLQGQKQLWEIAA